MRMLVRSEWAEAALPSRVAPQETNMLFCNDRLLSQQIIFAGSGVFLDPFPGMHSDPMRLDQHFGQHAFQSFDQAVQGKENYRNGKISHLSDRRRDPYTLLQPES